jgi:dTDP-glucose 4,6-dehydratase
LKNIFLTGSEGFIGSHLTEKLVKSGHKVRCLVQYNFSNQSGWLDTIDNRIKKEIEIIPGDIRDSGFIEKVVGKKTEVIMNLAALIGIPYSYLAPKSYIDTNIYGLLNVLNAAKKLVNLESLIQTSTSEVYGTPTKLPINETHQLSAQSPYAASKIAADQLALSFHKSFGLPVSVIRPFNTYGPRQSTRAIIPTIITQCLKGSTVNVGSLHPTRDFVYVADIVLGFEKAIGNKKSIGEVINLGTGYEISIGDLIKIVLKVFNSKSKIKINFQKIRKRPNASEVLRLLASNKKAKKILNWSPNLKGKAGFEKGIRNTIDWYKQEKNIKYFKSNKFVY